MRARIIPRGSIDKEIYVNNEINCRSHTRDGFLTAVVYIRAALPVARPMSRASVNKEVREVDFVKTHALRYDVSSVWETM